MCVSVTVDDYEDDEDDEVHPAAAGAKQPLSAAKDTVGKLAEKASIVAGVSACPVFTYAGPAFTLSPCMNIIIETHQVHIVQQEMTKPDWLLTIVPKGACLVFAVTIPAVSMEQVAYFIRPRQSLL